MQSNSYVSAILCPLQTACINNKIHLCPYHPLQDKALGHRYKSSSLKKRKCLSILAQLLRGRGDMTILNMLHRLILAYTALSRLRPPL